MYSGLKYQLAYRRNQCGNIYPVSYKRGRELGE